MRTYIATTGILFAAVAVAHIWRMIEEGTRLLTEPVFVVLTLLAVVLAGWAAKLLTAK